MKTILKILLFIATLLIASYFWPIHEWLLASISWIRASGAWGVVAFGLIYIAATIMLMPAYILTLGAGFIYGPIWGVLLISVVSNIGAFIAFSISRSRLRSWVIEKISHNVKFDAIDNAVGKQGFKIVLFLRLSPVFSYTFLNYALGFTSVKAKHYLLASFMGMIPGTVIYTYLGSLAPSVSELTSELALGGSQAQSAFIWLGFAVTVLVTAYITYIARCALRDAVSKNNQKLNKHLRKLET